MDRKLGIVVFSSNSGLGNQSRRLTQMLKPERILLINNASFSKNSQQHPEWYEGFSGFFSEGFPSIAAVTQFLKGLTHLYIIENPLNWSLIQMAKRLKIKTYIASNYEFCDNLNKPHLPLPDMFLMPSHWMVQEMQNQFPTVNVKYLPPPVFPNEFKTVRDYNFNRVGKRRFLHVVGTLAAADRNGTLLLLEALKHTTGDFEFIIKSQHPLPEEYQSQDSRVYYRFGTEPEVADLYRDFDAMIMPRRFGGLCLPMQEALMSGLPVIMPDISPNNDILPKDWLIPATHSGTIQTRTTIDLFAAHPLDLARKIDSLATISGEQLEFQKADAFGLAHKEFAPSNLEGEYEKIW